MPNLASEITPINIEDELKQSYLDYAMSVIVGRALPDVRDGLKPVHRRILFAMHELGNDYNKPYKKSARVVGDVIGKYHPHGDTAVYDALVRMAQDFSLRYTLIDGQGNFGSVDGDPPAAMRYTEVRLRKIAHSLLIDLDKETVDFIPNYDESELYPHVLPTRVPNLLVNGGSGIAVGMATNIPPHNLNEVIDATIALIDNDEISIEGLMEHIKGPDFPTAGIINGRAGIIDAYKTGKGKIYVRARVEVEVDEKTTKESIIIKELPYQVNKARLIEKIAELVKLKKIEGIAALRDESDKDGMRAVIELKRGEKSDIILNNLYAQTQLQTVFGINFVALVDEQPRSLNLKEILTSFVKHRKEVVSRRTVYELRKSRNRAHILEGLGVALSNIDPVIALIKSAKTPQEAKTKLLDKTWSPGQISQILSEAGGDICRPEDLESSYGLFEGSYNLSPVQAQAILDLKLHRLTGLEQEKIISEFKEIIEKIKYFLGILGNKSILMKVIKDELLEIKDNFGDKRKTEISSSQLDLTVEDLITPEDLVVTLSNSGYVKSQSLDSYQAQRRGGKGKSATSVKSEDYITKLLIANTHDTLLCFSSAGKVYWLKVYQLPIGSRNSRGRPIVNLLPLDVDETITAILPIKEYEDDKAIFMATASGLVKKVSLSSFARPRVSGIIAIDLTEGDSLIGAKITGGSGQILLSTNAGKAIRFKCSDVRCMGRGARGVRGIKLDPEQKVISLIVLKEGGAILNATKNGFGKRTDVNEFSVFRRGGKGVRAIQTSTRNGEVVGALQVFPKDELMLISDQGTLVRIRVEEISQVGRNAQGVKLINLSSEEHLVEIQRIQEIAEDNSDSLELKPSESLEATDLEESTDSETSSDSKYSDLD